MEEKLIVCECHNVEHQMIIYYDEEFNQAYVEFHLVKLPFWGRLINGIRYIFGRKSRFGDFDEMVIGEKYGKYFKDLGEKLIKGKPSE